MNQWEPIRYLGFWDVPLNFFVRHHGSLYLFDCPFDEKLEDYSLAYQVYLMPEIPEVELPKDWTTLPARAICRLGDIPVTEVRFDPTMRQQMDASVLNRFNSHPSPLSR
jgi:hypothetical protein